jgi:hypothetical protein
MAKGRRTTPQREHDLIVLAEMYLHGARQVDIAEALDLTQQTVSNDFQTLVKRWRESSLIDINQAKAVELSRIDELMRTYWQAWDQSKEEQQSTTTKRVSDQGTGDRAEATVRKTKRLGNPAYLRGVQWCIERRCKILGIDAPDNLNLTGGVATEVTILYRDELKRRHQGESEDRHS